MCCIWSVVGDLFHLHPFVPSLIDNPDYQTTKMAEKDQMFTVPTRTTARYGAGDQELSTIPWKGSRRYQTYGSAQQVLKESLEGERSKHNVEGALAANEKAVQKIERRGNVTEAIIFPG